MESGVSSADLEAAAMAPPPPLPPPHLDLQVSSTVIHPLPSNLLSSGCSDQIVDFSVNLPPSLQLQPMVERSAASKLSGMEHPGGASDEPPFRMEDLPAVTSIRPPPVFSLTG